MHSALQMITNNMFYNNSSSKPVNIINKKEFTINDINITGNGILVFSQINTLYFPGFNGINRIDFIKKLMESYGVDRIVFNVEFIPEPNNKYDKYALKIVGKDSLSDSDIKVDLGYVPVDPQIIINKNSTYNFNQYIQKMIEYENIVNPITYVEQKEDNFTILTICPFSEEIADEIIIPSFL